MRVICLLILGVMLAANQSIVIGVPLQFSNEEKSSIQRYETTETEEKKTNTISTQNRIKIEKSLIEQSTTESINKVIKVTNPEFNPLPLRKGQYYYRISLTKRDTNSPKKDAYDSSNGKETYEAVNKENVAQVRASPIPFLSKGEGGNETNSGGLPSIPGLPQIPGLSNSMPTFSNLDSKTPTAIIGGFSVLIMPMPGLTMSNIGSALQAGHQMSQSLPAMPSLPTPG